MEEKETLTPNRVDTDTKPRKQRQSFLRTQFDGMAQGGAPLLFTMLLTFLVTILACVAVFFANLRGEEQVMVPNVKGKSLTNALLEMQEKELYPKIQLRYSDNMADAGTILEQEPEAGAIVKAYRRVSLTVSRGVAMDYIDDYRGKNIEQILPTLQAIFGGENTPVQLATPVYKKDDSLEGTILAQYPEEGTYITEKVKLQLIVSGGNKDRTTQVPTLTGMTIKQVLKQLSTSEVVFDFTSHEAYESENAGTVTGQDNEGQEITAWSRVRADFALKPKTEDDKTITGILNTEISEYPYPVQIRLEANDSEGKNSTVVTCNHPGGEISLPYEVTAGTTLILYVLDEEVYRQQID